MADDVLDLRERIIAHIVQRDRVDQVKARAILQRLGPGDLVRLELELTRPQFTAEYDPYGS